MNSAEPHPLPPIYEGRTTLAGDLLAAALRTTARYAQLVLPSDRLELRTKPSSYIEGLQLLTTEDGAEIKGHGPIVGTLRMGYGHYRFAQTIVDSALSQGFTPFWHDLTQFPVVLSHLLHKVDRLYSRFSRVATETGKWADYLWEGITSSGNWDSLKASIAAAPLFVPLMGQLDRSRPFISTFIWAGHIAQAAGFQNVVHLVNDNAPMPFIIVPGAMNLVQSPSMYAAMLQLGVPAAQLEIAGHWVPENMVRSIPRLTELRIRRLEEGTPRRMLISIGGAGSQLTLVSRIIKKTAPFLRDGRLSLFINTGDHIDIFDALVARLEKLKLEFSTVTEWSVAEERARSLHLENRDTAEPGGVTVFNIRDTFGAVLLTDLLLPAVDALITKPSELAFYPVPKLLLHRVGKFEGFGALRASELGGGTPECRSWGQTKFYLKEFALQRDLLYRINERIASSGAAGIYDGSIKAVEIATSRA